MTIISKSKITKPEIDLNSPDGNVFALMGYARFYGRQLSMTPQGIKDIETDMMSSDYEHAVAVFDKHFGEYVDLIR